MAHKIKKKAIATLNKLCSFTDLVRDPNGKLDCRKPATSAVVGPNQNLYWRCPGHEGKYTAEVSGAVRYMVEVTENG